jgi:methionyl-tRNA formyltransferase
MRYERKRIAILTRDGAEHRYVVNTLCARMAIDRIVVDLKPPKANVRRAMRQGLNHFVAKAARTGFLKLIDDDGARIRSLQQLLGKNGESFNEPDKLDYVDGINSSNAIARLKEVDPDAILVYGTSVINDTVLGLARDICFNMHTGISPYYRGTACAFWPIVNGELEMLGATIHECTSRIDGGAIFETVHTSCQTGDNLHTVFGRAVMVGADAYARVAEHYLAGTLKGKPQDLSLGREYRGSELTLGPELAARRRLARMKKAAPRRFERTD